MPRGFHLSQPDVALEIVGRTRDIVPEHIPVTLKMRRGLDDSAASRDNFFHILDGAFRLGAAGDYRSRSHGSATLQWPSRWSFLAEVKQHVGSKTILGSGDLFTAEDCLRMMEETGVDGVTVARGCIGNPWIFQQCQALAAGQPLPDAPTIFEQRRVLERHWELAESVYGPLRTGPLLRKFGIKYTGSHPDHLSVRQAFTNIRTREDWMAVLDRWYAVDGPAYSRRPSCTVFQGSGCEENQ